MKPPAPSSASARASGSFKVGERVALHHHVPCLECHACRHHAFAQCAQYKRTGITAGFEPAGGGYAEYVRVMPFVLPGVVRIPARNSFLEGAMLEPVNTVLKAVKRLALLRGDTVLVAGQGPIGLMFTRLLALQGMRVVATDLLPACSADEQVERLEQRVSERVKLRAQFSFLKTVPGIGQILALTIMLETGDIGRFATVGHYASYCRCVGSQKLSNGKRKGSGNTKNGNKYLAWAFVEAANFAIRFNSKIKSFYQRKKAKTKAVVAIKAVAHKLCRACYHIMKDQVAFDVTKAFGQK